MKQKDITQSYHPFYLLYVIIWNLDFEF